MTTTEPTLDQLLWQIADKVPEFRTGCPCFSARRMLERCEACMHDHTLNCLRCHGKGYVPKPAHELAETLWKTGYTVVISYIPSVTGYSISAVVESPNLTHGVSVLGTDPMLTLAQAVVKVLGI